MTKSATDVMQDILAAAVLDALAALKTASRGLPNNLLRDIGAIHANTTFADLPPELQAAIAANVRVAFTRLLKNGYAIGPSGGQETRRPPPRPAPPDGERTRRGSRPPGRRDGPARPTRPGRGPKPRN